MKKYSYNKNLEDNTKLKNKKNDIEQTIKIKSSSKKFIVEL